MTSRTGHLEFSDALFRRLAESTSAAVFIIARDRFQYVNPAMAVLVGCSVEQLIATDPYDLIHPDSLPEALRRLPAARFDNALPSRWDLRMWTRRGDSICLAVSTKVLEVEGDFLVASVGVDVTGMKGEARANPVPERDAASHFVRGLAHDLNDLLQVVQGHTDRLSEELDVGSPLLMSSTAIRDAAARAAELAQDLLMFSRQLLPQEETGRKSETIDRPVVLLVEDEEPVRELIGETLERHGFEVLMAASGEEGLKLEEEQHVDILLSDVMLPGQNGFQMAGKIRRRSPHVRVIFMSGYTGEADAGAAGLERDIPLIQKPFKMVDLMNRIRALLRDEIGGDGGNGKSFL